MRVRTASGRARRAIRASAIVAASLAFLTGCSGSVSPFAAFAPPPAPAPPEPPPDGVAGGPIEAIDVADVPATYDMRIAFGEERAVSADWAYLDGGDSLNARLDSWLFEALDAWASEDGATTVRYTPAAIDHADLEPETPKLRLLTETIQASGQFYGVRLVSSRGTEAKPGARDVDVVYLNTATGTLTESESLVAPDQVPSLQQLIVDTLSASFTAEETAEEQSMDPELFARPPGKLRIERPRGIDHPLANVFDLSPAEVLNDIGFASDGDLVLSYPPGRVGPAEAGPVNVHVRAEAARPMLTDLGRAVQEQVAGGVPFTAPAAAQLGTRHVNCDLVPCVALTYDDGPRPDTTPELVELLRQNDAFATFFSTGTSAAQYPDTARATAEAGHLVESHTWDHPDLTTLEEDELKQQVERTQTTIAEATGVAPTMLRPPYGAFNDEVKAQVGLPMIFWSVDSLDWSSRDPEVFVPHILDTVQPGGIVLMHDIHQTTIDGQAELLSALRDAGYAMVQVDQLFHGIQLQPGSVYFCRGHGSNCTPGR